MDLRNVGLDYTVFRVVGLIWKALHGWLWWARYRGSLAVKKIEADYVIY
jgi:hypothetical protein